MTTTKKPRGLILPDWKVRHALTLAVGETMQVRLPMEPQPVIAEAFPKPPHNLGDVVYGKESLYIDDYLYSHGGKLPDDRGDILPETIYYQADGTCCEQIPECMCATEGRPRWRAASRMPAWAARLWFTVREVRVQRIQDIGIYDVRDEGVETAGLVSGFEIEADGRSDGNEYDDPDAFVQVAKQRFSEYWDAQHSKKHPWQSNPWVFVYVLERTARP